MIFRVRYLDRDALSKDIEIHNSNIPRSNISPQDKSWADYFRISEDISSNEYKIAYYEDSSKPGVKQLGIEHFLVIEVNNELIFVDSYMLIRIWSQEGQLSGNTFLEKMDNIFKNSLPTEHCYSWDSIIDRIKLLNKHNEYKFIEIDKVLKRETKINKILKK